MNERIKGKREGYWEEFYNSDNKLLFTCTYKNDLRHGLLIAYHQDGQLWLKGSYIYDVRIGFWLEYNSSGQIKYKNFYL